MSDVHDTIELMFKTMEHYVKMMRASIEQMNERMDRIEKQLEEKS